MHQRGSGGRGNHGFVPRDSHPPSSSHHRPSVAAADVVDIVGSDSALRLQPIRPSGVGFGLSNSMASPPLHSSRDTYMRESTLGASMIMGARDTLFGDSLVMGGTPQTRPRRTSTDEIRALLQRTNMALDKIVKIRESMEPFVDFKQFDKSRPPRRASTGTTRTLSQASSTFDDVPIADAHQRIHPGSYSSTVSEDPVGDRSTGSTQSTSSTEDMASASEELELSSSHDESQELTTSGALDETQQEQEQQSHDDDELSDFDDDERDSTFYGNGEDISPFKEARLERLKNITIAFHDGLPTEFFMAVTRFLHSSVEIKTRHSRFSFFKDTFIGSDVVRDMVLTGFADDQANALRFGHILVKLGYIEHVSKTEDQLHNSKDNFYRFTKAIDLGDSDAGRGSETGNRRMSINAANYRESVLSRESTTSTEYDFTEASCEVHALVTDEALAIIARVLHKVFERKNKLLFYKGVSGCFLGAEAVNIMRDLRIGKSHIDAVLIGQALLDEKIIEPVAPNVTTFQDRYVFYRMTSAPS
jgi:hypothetical protein